MVTGFHYNVNRLVDVSWLKRSLANQAVNKKMYSPTADTICGPPATYVHFETTCIPVIFASPTSKLHHQFYTGQNIFHELLPAYVSQ